MQTQSISQSGQPSGKRCFRAVNYVALANVREKSATNVHNPARKASLLAAARYARKKATENKKPR